MGATEKTKARPESDHVYPDGGYGWVIVVAYSLNSVLIVQMISIFGLIFKDLFREMNFPATDIATIMNLNISFSLLIGIFIGVLIRRFGYRKVSVVGSLFAGVGTLLTSYSTNFGQFLVSYGLITSVGVGLNSPAHSVALASYFRDRRSHATGVAMGATGLAGILFPQLVSFLIREYGSRGTCLIFAGLALNGLVAAALLQPVAWHRPPKRTQEPPDAMVVDVEREEEKDPMLTMMLGDEFKLPALPVLEEETDADLENERFGFENRRRRGSSFSSYHTARRPSETTMWASASILDLGCSWGALDQVEPEESGSHLALPRKLSKVHNVGNGKALTEAVKLNESQAASESPKADGLVTRLWRRLLDSLDLSLLADPSILNLMLGMSLAFFSETNFSQFIPFILSDRGMDTQRIATVMSIMSVADVVSKLVAPFVQGALRMSSRIMYIAALSLLIVARTALVMVRDGTALLVVAVALGSIKGFRSVFYYQVIPDSVPQERIASAIGLQAVINGIVFLAVGPLIGFIRDRTGQYDLVIMTFNGFTLICVMMWLTEYAVQAVRRSRLKSQS